MKNSTLLFVTTFLLFIASCTKDKLPKATQSGKNTFGCKIDGKVFTPSESGGLFGSPPITVYNDPFNGFTLLGKYYGDRSDKISKNIIISLLYLKTTDTYQLSSYPYGQYELDYSGGPIYRTNNTYTGQVNITRCDTIKRIYSGTFSFKAVDRNTGKVVNVTDGRFDVKQQ